MSSILFTSLSALMAEGKRLQLSAENIANLRSRGLAEGAERTADGGFVPRRLVQSSLPGGGVIGRAVAIDPASAMVYEPGSGEADAEGFVVRPNVDLEAEFLSQILARRAYEASVRMLEEEARRLRYLSDLLA
jgi:flagellar basal-body rod protein FlgC